MTLTAPSRKDNICSRYGVFSRHRRADHPGLFERIVDLRKAGGAGSRAEAGPAVERPTGPAPGHNLQPRFRSRLPTILASALQSFTNKSRSHRRSWAACAEIILRLISPAPILPIRVSIPGKGSGHGPVVRSGTRSDQGDRAAGATTQPNGASVSSLDSQKLSVDPDAVERHCWLSSLPNAQAQLARSEQTRLKPASVAAFHGYTGGNGHEGIAYTELGTNERARDISLRCVSVGEPSRRPGIRTGENTLTISELDRDDGGLGCHEIETRACFHAGRGGIPGTSYEVGSHRQARTRTQTEREPPFVIGALQTWENRGIQEPEIHRHRCLWQTKNNSTA